MSMRTVFVAAALFVLLTFPGRALAGDPCVLRFLGAKLNYTTLDSVRFEVEVQNSLGFPALQYRSYFRITPIGDSSRTERFDIPEFTFPAMTKMTVGMTPQFWRPKVAGLHRVEFFSSSPDDIDTSNNYARWNFFVAYGNPLLDRSAVSTLVNRHISLNLRLDSLTDVAMVAQSPLHGKRIISRDSTEFDMTLDSTQWFAWIETDKYARFSKHNWFVLVDRVDSTVRSYHTNWQPTLNGLSYPFTIGGRKEADLVYGSPVQPEHVASLELISETDTSTRQPRSCAILVTGGQDEGTAFDDAFDNDINTMRNNLTLEKLGPRIHPDDVIVLRYPSPEEVREELRKLKGKCSNVYFVYSGHGGRWSMLLQDFYFYTDFLADLDEIGADSVSILIDACHSGALIDALDTLKGVLENTHVTAVTACAADTIAYMSKIITGTGDTIALATYAWAFAKYFGDPEADIDGVPGTSFAETYAWLSGADPLLAWSGTPLMDEMKPQLRVRPRKTAVPLLDRDAAAKTARDWMRAQPGIDSTQAAGYLLQRPLHGVRVTGRDASAYDRTLDSLSWFGWFDRNAYGSFGKPVTYFTINRKTGAVSPDSTDWYPSLDNIPYPGTTTYPASRDLIFGGPRFALPVTTFQTIAEPDTTSPRDGKSCAVFVSGGDYLDRKWTERFTRSIDLMLNEQLRERRGIRVDTADILRLTNPTPTQLRTGLDGLKGPYDRVFFYYSGNGRPDTMQLRLPFAYKALVQDLDGLGTGEIEIVIDAPGSGSIIGDLINVAPTREGVKWTVATSSAEREPAYGEMFADGTGDTLALPSFTHAFSRWYGAVETDRDSVSGTSIAETFYRIHNRNDKPGWSNRSIRQAQRPQLYIDGVVPRIYNTVKIEDINLRFDFTRLPDSSAQLRYRMRPLDTGFPRQDSILFISPGRMWTFDLRDNLSAFELNMSFATQPGLDSVTPPMHARLGIVRRDTSGRTWEIFRMSLPDWNTGSVHARQVSRFSDWALAYVRNITPSHASAALATTVNVESPPVVPTVVDGDPGDSFVFSIVTQPSNGTARIESNALRYMPNAGFTGTDSFTFRATDEAGDWVDGIASVKVWGSNTQPVASDDEHDAIEDTPIFLDVLANDTDADDDVLRITSTGSAAHGSVAILGDTLIQYIPAENYSGSDMFDYTITDDRGGTAAAEVAVTVLAVNDPPAAFMRTAPVDAENVTDETVELRWSASADVEGDTLRYLVSLTTDGRNHLWTTGDTMRSVTRGELGLAGGAFAVTWQVSCTDGADTTAASNGEGRFTFDTGTGVESFPATAADIQLLSHHPEPFRDAASIDVSLRTEYSVRISIHSLMGQQLTVLAGGRLGPGLHTVRWNGSDAEGRLLPSGVYIAVLSADGHAPITRRLTLLR
jgi:hypothetical protein